MDFNDLQNAVQDHEDRITTQEDLDLDNRLTPLEDLDLTNVVPDLQANEGQLVFPLSQDTVDLIKNVFPVGTVSLAGGSATVTDSRISTGSIIFLSDPSGTKSALSYTATAGSMSIQSSGSATLAAYVIFS